MRVVIRREFPIPGLLCYSARFIASLHGVFAHKRRVAWWIWTVALNLSYSRAVTQKLKHERWASGCGWWVFTSERFGAAFGVFGGCWCCCCASYFVCFSCGVVTHINFCGSCRKYASNTKNGNHSFLVTDKQELKPQQVWRTVCCSQVSHDVLDGWPLTCSRFETETGSYTYLHFSNGKSCRCRLPSVDDW